ncbi:MAG: GGDEF domain-containing protein [Lachnospiraceae bacterium]|nr:GGDEF domain-containing protein [Lachnospiraceae bacterium]
MREHTRKMLLACTPGILSVIVLIVIVMLAVSYDHLHEVERFDTGWRIRVGEEGFPVAALSELPELLDRKLSRGETVRIERTMPDTGEASPTLELLVNYFAVEVFLEDEVIGEIAMDRFLDGGYVGGNRYYVCLPADYAGKRLSLVFHASEDRLPPVIYPPRFGSFHELNHTMMQRYGYALLIGVFMCLFGGFFLFFSLMVSVLLPEVKGQRLSSLISIVLGIWILTHYRVLAFFTEGTWLMTVEYLSFYLLLPLLILLVAQVHETNRFYRLFERFVFAAVGISFVLHFTGVLYMHRTRYVYYGICTFYLMMLIRMFVIDIREKKTAAIDMVQMAAPALFCVMVFIAMCFNLPTGEDIEVQTVSIVILTTGPLFFAMARFLVYGWMMMEAAPQKFKFDALRELAYTDGLTGLHNRMLTAERYEELNKGEGDYCLISLDLNGLKYVNDTFGHDEGDRLIRFFGRMLRAVLPEGTDVMRVGGDEFLAISETMDEHAIRGCMTALERRFSSLDQANERIPHSFAYGYAYHHEFPEADAHGVYLQADARMYARKHGTQPAQTEG